MFVVYTLLLLMLGEIFCLPYRPVVIGTSSCSATVPKRFYLPHKWSDPPMTTLFPLKKVSNGHHHVHKKLVFILRRWIRRWILLAIDHRPGWNEGSGHRKFSAARYILNLFQLAQTHTASRPARSVEGSNQVLALHSLCLETIYWTFTE